jgi:hypothetical protein
MVYVNSDTAIERQADAQQSVAGDASAGAPLNPVVENITAKSTPKNDVLVTAYLQ